jgi:predicted esterase
MSTTDSRDPHYLCATGLPPVINVHGDRDSSVPYTQVVQLRDELTKVGVPNQLVTISGGQDGNFSDDKTIEPID